MDTVWISHWKYSGVYCNHFLPTPWGDFSQRQHGNYFKSINCKSLPRQINTFPPGVQGDRHRNCYSLILCIAKHSTEGIFANSGPWLPILDVLRVGGGEGGRKTVLPSFSSCESLCGYSHTKNFLSLLLPRSGSSLAYSFQSFCLEIISAA